MSRPATSRLKCNPPLGRMPVLQFLTPDELAVDESYQRSLDASSSQSLIRKIAQFWNWDLCQPLVVARRDDDGLYVIDGQHRLEAAKMRGDIPQLPCVVVSYSNAADEAASFVHLNQQRRPLTKLDLFKAAVASEDPESRAILKTMEEAGLTLAPHSNYTAWKPGMVSNIGGIERAWRRRGAASTTMALRALSQAFAGKILRYGGTLFPGIAAICQDEFHKGVGEKRLPQLVHLLTSKSQAEWRKEAMQLRASEITVGYSEAIEKCMREAWARRYGDIDLPPVVKPAPQFAAPSSPVQIAPKFYKPSPAGVSREFKADEEGKSWCDQCDRRKDAEQVGVCADQFCPLRLWVPA